MSIQETSPTDRLGWLRMPLVLLAAMLVGAGLAAGIFLAINGGTLSRPQAEEQPLPSPVAMATAHAQAAVEQPAAGALANPHSGGDAGAPVQRLSLADAKAQLEGGTAVFVDLRSSADFAAGHIDKALSITSMDLEEKLKGLPAETVVIAYGANADAAVSGAQIFRDIGFANVAALDGSFSSWQEQGFPVAKGS